jgi:hypothetical protein
VKERLMRFYRNADVPEDVQGMWCRQSRLAGVVRCIIFSGVVAVPAIVGWTSHHPWVLWIGTAVAVAIVPLLLMDVAKLFRATNWVLRIGPDGVWINLRSYRDKATETLSVVRVEYREMASVGRHTESYSTPSKMATGSGSYGAVGGSTIWRDEFLEIQLNHDQTDELKTALSNLRHPTEPDQAPLGQAPVRSGPYPVWLVSPAVLRIGWVSGHGHAVLPRIATVLARLDGSMRVAEPTRRERPDWRKMNAEEVEELARELVHVHGATFEATALLVRAGGITHAEAATRVQRCEEAPVRSAEFRG